MQEQINQQLPEGWKLKPLGEIASINPRLDKSAIDDETEVSFVPMAAVEAESGKIDVSESRNFIEVKKGYTGFVENDVLFAKITPCMENGKMAVVPRLKNGVGFGSTEFHVIRVNKDVLAKYIYYVVSSKQFRSDAEHNMTGAVGQRRVPAQYLQNALIAIPSLSAQEKIVTKIEELFSELDSGIASLKTTQEQLKIYRQSLLKHAFEGKLTEQWRKDNPDKLENPEQLLARIQQEREARYQQQLEKWQQAVKDWEAQGKEGRIPRKPAKFKNTEPLSLNEISELAPIPDSWIWHRFGSFYEMLSGFAFKKSDYSESGVRLFQIANVGFGKTIWESTAYLPENFKDMYQNLILEEGDLVMALNRPMLGDSLKVAILGKQDCPSILYQRVGRFSFNNYSNSKYFLYFLQSSHFTSKLKNELRGVNIPFINQTRLAEYSLPYCSFAEQQEIVNQLEEKLSIIEQNEKEIEAALAKVELLRQSILKKAFSGRLV